MALRVTSGNRDISRSSGVEGLVEVFVVSKPPPEKAYGWIADSMDGVDYVAVLGTPPINSPLDAVRAWIVLQSKK